MHKIKQKLCRRYNVEGLQNKIFSQGQNLYQQIERDIAAKLSNTATSSCKLKSLKHNNCNFYAIKLHTERGKSNVER